MTTRERLVLALVMEGLRDRQIAASLDISRHTVDAHMRRLLVKAGVNSRVELVVLAARHGWIRPEKFVSAT